MVARLPRRDLRRFAAFLVADAAARRRRRRSRAPDPAAPAGARSCRRAPTQATRASTSRRASASSSRRASARSSATGLAVAIPEGYAGFVQPRSGLATKHGISIVNTPGLVDSGYRGELRVTLLNTDARETFVVEPGMRIAQLVVLPVPEVEPVEVESCPSRSAACAASARRH